MINYIIGIGTAIIVIAIIVRGIRKRIRGDSGGCGCGSSWSSCSGCSSNSCECGTSSSTSSSTSSDKTDVK